MSNWRERRRPFDFEIRISGLFGGEPFSFRITPKGIRTKGFETARRSVRTPTVEEREPLVEVRENKDRVVVIADIPGVPKEAIELNATEDSLTISADTPTRKYYKAIDLPAKVDPKRAKATYNNGVLEVKLAKIEEGKGKRIKID